jgi:hypothetical protein
MGKGVITWLFLVENVDCFAFSTDCETCHKRRFPTLELYIARIDIFHVRIVFFCNDDYLSKHRVEFMVCII